MFEAQLLNNNSAVFSPWMQRGGDNMRFTVDVVDRNLSEIFRVELFEKNTEDPGPGLSVGTALDIPITGSVYQFYQTNEGLKELVRYKFYFAAAATGDWVLFRMLAPVWFNAVKA